MYEAFDNYCPPKVNESIESHVFNSRAQRSGESFSSFLTDLKKLSASCNFGALRDSIIKDRIISGIADQEVKNHLLREEELTLEKCEKICRVAELADIQVKALNDEESKIQEIKSKSKNQNKDFKEKGTEESNGRMIPGRAREAAARKQHAAVAALRRSEKDSDKAAATIRDAANSTRQDSARPTGRHAIYVKV